MYISTRYINISTPVYQHPCISAPGISAPLYISTLYKHPVYQQPVYQHLCISAPCVSAPLCVSTPVCQHSVYKHLCISALLYISTLYISTFVYQHPVYSNHWGFHCIFNLQNKRACSTGLFVNNKTVDNKYSSRHSTCTCCNVTCSLVAMNIISLLCKVPKPESHNTKLYRCYPIVFLSTNRQPPVGQDLLFAKVPRSHSDTPQSAGLLWTSDQPDTGISS